MRFSVFLKLVLCLYLYGICIYIYIPWDIYKEFVNFVENKIKKSVTKRLQLNNKYILYVLYYGGLLVQKAYFNTILK